MVSNLNKHHRRSVRLQGYDYSRPGAYFVTIVAQRRGSLFGEVVDGEIHLNPAGQMVEKWWQELISKFPNVSLDEHIIMPNHFHGIVVINERPPVGVDLGVDPESDVDPQQGGHAGPPQRPPQRGSPQQDLPQKDLTQQGPGEHTGSPLPTIIQWFKTMTTNEYIRGVKQLGWTPFDGKLWQRNYYERIVRNQGELERIREYIRFNPLKWEEDRENPAHYDAYQEGGHIGPPQHGPPQQDSSVGVDLGVDPALRVAPPPKGGHVGVPRPGGHVGPPQHEDEHG